MRSLQAGAASALMSWLRGVCMHGGGLVAPPLRELNANFLVGCLRGWLLCSLFPHDLLGICDFRLLRMARTRFIVWVGVHLQGEESLR